MFQIEPALLDPYLLIGVFQHREVEIVLLADVIIQHALVGAGVGRDPVDARAGEAMRGKFLLRGLEDAKPHPLGITLPFQNSLYLGQNDHSTMMEDRDVARAAQLENGIMFYRPSLRAPAKQSKKVGIARTQPIHLYRSSKGIPLFAPC